MAENFDPDQDPNMEVMKVLADQVEKLLESLTGGRKPCLLAVWGVGAISNLNSDLHIANMLQAMSHSYLARDLGKTAGRFRIGQKVFRHYTAEPTFIYGSGKKKEEGEIIGPPVVWDEKLWWPVKWEYSQFAPDLALDEQIHPQTDAQKEVEDGGPKA